MQAKILVNATTLVVGGGIQVGISFMEYASRADHVKFDFVFAVSQAIYDGLSIQLQKDSRVRVFPKSPARIVGGHKSRSMLKELEKDFQPDIVYTLGLPSYTRFRTLEVGRYTNPWEINPEPLPWSSLPLNERIAVWLKTRYRLFWARRAKFFETQTESAKVGIAKRLGVLENRIKVIPNSPNPVFFSPNKTAEERLSKDHINIFCLAAAYRHKNLGIIPEVADCLRKQYPNRIFNFLITIPQEERITKEIFEKTCRLGVNEMIKNLGPLKLNECVYWYENSDIVFLPTLLEVFSATYVEAMAMSKPIVTTDLDFARSVCGDAALYYDPKSAKAAAEAIMAIVRDHNLRVMLIERGKIQLKHFPDLEKKHQVLFDWLSEVCYRVKS